MGDSDVVINKFKNFLGEAFLVKQCWGEIWIYRGVLI